MSKKNLYRLVATAMLAALAVVGVVAVHFPILPAAPYLEYDISDVFVLLGGLMFGPLSGLVILVIAAAVQALTVSASSGPVGFVMHVCSSSALVVISGLLYHRIKNKKIALPVGLLAGCLSTVALMIPLNILLTGFYNGVPIPAIIQLIIPVIIPFNAIKCGANSIFATGVFIALQATGLMPRLVGNRQQI